MNASAPQLTVIVRQFTARYRAALLRKAGLLAALGAAGLGLLGWRLSALGIASWWSIGAPSMAALLAGGGLLWWLRHRWISRRNASAFLDHTLGLQQRLITAEEFAATQPPPALYPLLMEDASSRAAADGATLPRAADRTAVAMAILLVLLLVLPFGGRSPLTQLAQLPTPFRAPEPPPRVPPPSLHQQDSSQSQQPSQSGSGGQNQPQPSGGGQSQSQPSPRDGSGQQSESNTSGQQGQGGSAQQQHASGTQGSGQGQQQSSGGKQQTSPQQSQGSQKDGGQNGKAGQQQNASGQQGKEEQSSGASQSQNASADQRQGQHGDQQAQSASRQSGNGRGMSSGDQEAMKAEIQQLLKEVSGELKELQGQLAAEQPQGPPSIGTNTDPDLFEAPMALDPKTGQPVPINLQTDNAAIHNPRTGGGSGTPTGEVLSDAPQARPEDAQLSDTPLEEQPAGRQVIPPEYRNAFDRLSGNGTQPKTSEGKP